MISSCKMIFCRGIILIPASSVFMYRPEWQVNQVPIAFFVKNGKIKSRFPVRGEYSFCLPKQPDCIAGISVLFISDQGRRNARLQGIFYVNGRTLIPDD